MATTNSTKKPVGRKTTTTTTKKTKTPTQKQEVITKVEKAYEPTETIWTTSVTAGELLMIGKKTKNLYRWSDYGDTTEIEYQDLLSSKASKDPYIFSPLFIIDDEDLLNSKGWEVVKNAYEKMYTVEEIDNLFNLDIAAFKKALTELPKGLINTVKTMAAEKIENKTLDSINKINTLDEVLGTDLKLFL